MAAVYLFVAFGGFCADYVPSKAFIPYLISVIYLLISELYLQKPDPLKNWAYAFASQMYVALAFALLNVLAFRYDALTNRTLFEPIYPLSIFLFCGRATRELIAVVHCCTNVSLPNSLNVSRPINRG